MSLRLRLGLGAGLALMAIFAAPRLPLLYWSFAAVCHQIPARCLVWLGQPLPVCARCLGIYAGALAAAVRPVKAPPPLIWALAGVNLLDAAASALGNEPRFAIALAFCWPAASWLLGVAWREVAAGH